MEGYSQVITEGGLGLQEQQGTLMERARGEEKGQDCGRKICEHVGSYLFLFVCFLESHPQHMEFPRLGV